MARVTRSGAGRPGTAAVVIRTSERAMCGASASCWRTARSSRQLPGVAADALDRVQAQLEERGAHGADLVGGGGTHVVRLDDGAEPAAVAIACRPATPAPSTSTRAGRTVPAAVMNSGKNRGRRIAASSAQR